MRKCKLRIIAILLLVVFTQKLGLRVLLHNKYHSSSHQNNPGSSASYYQVQCDCLDEALVPLTPAKLAEIPAPATYYVSGVENNYTVFLSSATHFFYSLRGPPNA